MGFITDNTRSRWGRRRPYIFLGAIVAGLSYIVMWQLYEENSLAFNFTYFLALSLVFFLGLTIFATPYVAMGYEMSRDFHERTRLMAVAQWIGQWAWVIVPWFWPLIYDVDLFPSAAAGVRSLAIWVGLGCMGLALVPAIFVRSEPTTDADNLQELSRKNIKENLRVFIEGLPCRLPVRAFQEAVPGDLAGVQFVPDRGRLLVLHRRLPPVRRRCGRGGQLARLVRNDQRSLHVLPGHSHRHVRVSKGGKEEHVPSRPVGVRRRVHLFWWCFRAG